jgi:hypothetical protein
VKPPAMTPAPVRKSPSDRSGGVLPDQVCAECGAVFTPASRGARYCRPLCRAKVRERKAVARLHGQMVCYRCDRELPLEAFAVDRAKASGRSGLCLECGNLKTKAYYREHRDEVLAKAAAKRVPAPPTHGRCAECGGPMVGRPNRVVCSRRCKDARYRRLHPEAYREKQRRKRERRRAGQQADEAGGVARPKNRRRRDPDAPRRPKVSRRHFFGVQSLW